MDLWLVRHGEAVSEREDPLRPLSPDGARSVRAIAESLSGKMGTFDLVASSGKMRARQTAGILCAAAGYPEGKIVETEALLPNASPEAFHAFLEECGGAERILCVGHLPSIASIASHFLTPSDPVRFLFAPGTVCRIRLSHTRRSGGELLMFL